MRASPSRISTAAACNTPRGKVLGRLILDQRPGLRPRQPAGFRPLGGGGRPRLGLPDVLPYFKRAETRAEGGDAWRGGATGRCRRCYGRSTNPLYRAFIEAARQAGYPETQDINGFQQEGFGRMDMTVHGGPALERRQRLSQAGAAAAEPRATHARARDAHRRSRAGARSGVRYRQGESEAAALARRGAR